MDMVHQVPFPLWNLYVYRNTRVCVCMMYGVVNLKLAAWMLCFVIEFLRYIMLSSVVITHASACYNTYFIHHDSRQDFVAGI